MTSFQIYHFVIYSISFLSGPQYVLLHFLSSPLFHNRSSSLCQIILSSRSPVISFWELGILTSFQVVANLSSPIWIAYFTIGVDLLSVNFCFEAYAYLEFTVSYSWIGVTFVFVIKLSNLLCQSFCKHRLCRQIYTIGPPTWLSLRLLFGLLLNAVF